MDSSCLCGIIVPSRNGLVEVHGKEGSGMEQTTIAIDLAKSVFQVAVSSHHGSVDAERRLSRDRFLTYFAQQPPATIDGRRFPVSQSSSPAPWTLPTDAGERVNG